jgi:hypothetical protein
MKLVEVKKWGLLAKERSSVSNFLIIKTRRVDLEFDI